MMRNVQSLGAALLLAAGALGCSLSSSDPLPQPQLAGDVQFTLLQTTDIHHHANGDGHVEAGTPASAGTYARMSAYVNYVRSTAGHPVVLVDSGDWTMGTLYDLTLGKQPLALYYMDALRYDCVTLGNHEFDYSPVGLAVMLKAAQDGFAFHTPIVASNMDLNGNADLAPYFGDKQAIAPTRVQTLPNGLRVGYIGLMGKAAAGVAPASAPVSFKDYSANYAFVQGLVDGLRNAQGCHVVVALDHAGTDATGTSGEDVELARHVTGIDVIASGHNHYPLDSARTVANGAWNTRIICSGAFSTNVFRLDLTYHAGAKNTTVDASSNPAMTDAGLAAVHAGLRADPSFAFMVGNADQQLNAGLGSLFTKVARFPDYSPLDPSKGIYHPVGASAQFMGPNNLAGAQCPNGLGNLCADAVRSVPNGIINQVLLKAGWNGNPADPNLPGILAAVQASGYDPTPFTGGMVATGVIRGTLPAGGFISFADVYNVLPLGTSPDLSQAIPIGYPLISAYLPVADLQKLCAVQLVAQTGLTSTDFYLNLSGLAYTLKGPESYVYFKYATAAAVLGLTSQKASAGSVPAYQALGALSTLGTDSGAALLTAMAAGNPYAGAMVKLNDASPTQAQVAANLGALGQVAGAAAADKAAGTKSLNALIVSKALAAIDTVSGFSPADPACTGPAAPLGSTARYRVAADLYAIFMLGAAQAEFGVAINAYRTATGTETLSGANLAGAMANRINLDPSTPAVVETKEWMALLLYLITPPAQGGHFTSGFITPEYASSLDFSQFGTFGPAVKVRNASYPIASVGQLLATLGGLVAAP